MKTYKILICETNIWKFIVEAKNYNEAHTKAAKDEHISKRLIDSSWDVERITELIGETK